MDLSIQDTLNTIIDKIEKMHQQLQEVRDQVDVNCRNIATRLDRLETNRRRAMEEENSQNVSRSPRREWAQPYNTADVDAQYIKSVKVDAPSFDGRLDLHVYIDWQLAMTTISVGITWLSKKIWFAVMKLTGQAG